jgi:histidinol-phosphatase (PHP family)
MILGQHFMGSESDSVFVGRPSDDEDILKQYADLVIEGIATGKYLYLAHPDIINYIGSDEVYNKHISRLCHFMKEKEIPLEINVLGLWEQRPYPSTRFWEIAGKIGNTAVIGIDAHAPEQILNSEAIHKAEQFCETYGLKRVELALS